MSFFHILDILGTAAFAISGALSAMNKKLDVFGVLIFAFVTSVGGGTIRDLLIGETPVFWTGDLEYIYVIIFASIIAVIFRSKMSYLKNTLFLFDTIGLGLFTIIGVEIGIKNELHPLISVMLGTISGSFGGLVRDILSNDIPVILRKEIYASPCIVAGIIFILISHTSIPININYCITVLIVISIRLGAVFYGWELPSIYKKK